MWKFNRLGSKINSKCQPHVIFSDLFCQLWRPLLTRALTLRYCTIKHGEMFYVRVRCVEEALLLHETISNFSCDKYIN